MTAQSESRLESRVRNLGEAIHNRMKGEVPSVFNRHVWQGRMMEWAMRDADFKLDLFRFVDVLPMLKTRQQVTQHVREYLLKEGRKLPGVVNVALKAAWGGLVSGLASRSLRNHISEMARRFIVAENPEGAVSALHRLHRQGIGFSADLLGEATVSDDEVDTYCDRYRDLISALSDAAVDWPADPVIDANHMGAIPRANISLKLSALAAFLDPVDRVGCVARLKDRVLPLFLLAKEKNAFLNMDLEQWALHDITYDLFEELATHPELRSWPHMGIVVQAYLKTSARDVDRLVSLSQSRGTPLTVRLVKGAYWDYEVVHARQHGYPCPVFVDKETTDAHYEQLTEVMLDHADHLFSAFGSHNLRSVSHALAYAESIGLPQNAAEVQMLYGMAEPERKAIRAMGQRVRIYAPIGEMLPGMAYLVRRLLENTSNQGFLRLTHHEHVDLDRLLVRPKKKTDLPPTTLMVSGDVYSPFENCPHADFTDEAVCRTFSQAVDSRRDALPISVSIVVDGQTQFDSDMLSHVCPSDSDRVVTQFAAATVGDVEHAIDAAVSGWEDWRARRVEDRAILLEHLADRLEADRFALAAMQCWEVGKPWREADGDVAEAVDFCRYYARLAPEELGPHAQGNMWGEDNVLFYIGRGPTAVIAPWNFPLAILCGMASAALVAGNPVLIKPSGQSVAIAHALFEHMQEAGFPSNIVHFLPGPGRVIGQHLVDHPQVAQVAFTGSKDVGLGIVDACGSTQRGQPQVKRVVCEMGGKNAVIVDDDADLDEAVVGVLYSAFGFAGQKCSACSRVLVHDAVYETFVSRLIGACKSLEIAPAHEPHCDLGPVVDALAYRRLMTVIEKPGDGAEHLFVGDAPAGGFFVPPTIFGLHDPTHRLMQDELFGPVLVVMRVLDFESALDVALSTEFALTGGVFSRSPAHLDLARRNFRVGNLYLNRGCTGAMVGRQPFGGFGMSGMGTKAGGPGYLRHFADPCVVTENTMRRGFTPDVAL